MVEEADVVIVGARVAGSPCAIELARRGRKVIVIDAATFPSDTLSTHVLFPGCLWELKVLGVLDKLLAAGAPPAQYTLLNHGGIDAPGGYSPVGGINYAMCPRRPLLDMALVEAARDAGAEVREATKLTEVVTAGGRVTGIRWSDRDGNTGEIATKLVVGADGRRSKTADLVGAGEPYIRDENGRGLVFMYVDDPTPDDDPARHTLYQWRVGDTLGMYFPTDGQGGLTLFMGPKEDVAKFGQDLVYWHEMLAANPELSKRLAGGAPRTKLRKAADTFSYMRRSSGPGWALVGDSGHFKDPVIAQGIRDAVYHGRRLGIAAGEALDDPGTLDEAVYGWELARDKDTLSSYHMGLRLSSTHLVTPVEIEAFKNMNRKPALANEFYDVLSRQRPYESWFTYPRAVGWVTKAMLKKGTDRRGVVNEVLGEVKVDLRRRKELALLKSGRRIDGSTFDDYPIPEAGMAPQTSEIGDGIELKASKSA